jgi:DNA repair protein RecO
MSQKSFSCHGIVLKRSNLGETDRIVSLLTQEHGKLVVVAKGVRKLNSSNRASLEPGNLIKAFCIVTKSMPLLTQSRLINDCAQMDHNLKAMRSLSQLLEIFNNLFVEAELDLETFALILKLRNQIVSNQISSKHMRGLLGELIQRLGYQDPNDSRYETISEYIEALADKPMRSFAFLQIATNK